MTETEKVQLVQNGGRLTGGLSRHAEEKPDPRCLHGWRTIACDDDRDVIECSRCGRQQTSKCNFDDDFA